MESEHIDFPATDAGGSPDEELQRKCNNLILLHAAGPRHTCRPELTCSGSIPETRLHRTRPLPASEGLLQRGRKAKCSDGWIYTAALPVTEHQAVTKVDLLGLGFTCLLPSPGPRTPAPPPRTLSEQGPPMERNQYPGAAGKVSGVIQVREKPISTPQRDGTLYHGPPRACPSGEGTPPFLLLNPQSCLQELLTHACRLGSTEQVTRGWFTLEWIVSTKYTPHSQDLAWVGWGWNI
ncbi:uncharacterized protein LOC129406818 isoform X1 [Sorex araneus]|uniref:uncharacterized protein LOC129406818 isoform X1 n=1 Tax=Sorex araneus TaxID=42254 RepID=UPI0024340285|nr:uncharacterized protein LOC129406818 isoform X1 [Sorex araneus]